MMMLFVAMLPLFNKNRDDNDYDDEYIEELFKEAEEEREAKEKIERERLHKESKEVHAKFKKSIKKLINKEKE